VRCAQPWTPSDWGLGFKVSRSEKPSNQLHQVLKLDFRCVQVVVRATCLIYFLPAPFFIHTSEPVLAQLNASASAGLCRRLCRSMFFLEIRSGPRNICSFAVPRVYKPWLALGVFPVAIRIRREDPTQPVWWKEVQAFCDGSGRVSALSEYIRDRMPGSFGVTAWLDHMFGTRPRSARSTI